MPTTTSASHEESTKSAAAKSPTSARPIDLLSVSAMVAFALAVGLGLWRGERAPTQIIPAFIVAFELFPVAWLFVVATKTDGLARIPRDELRRLIIIGAFAGGAVGVSHLLAEAKGPHGSDPERPAATSGWGPGCDVEPRLQNAPSGPALQKHEPAETTAPAHQAEIKRRTPTSLPRAPSAHQRDDRHHGQGSRRPRRAAQHGPATGTGPRFRTFQSESSAGAA